MDSKKKILKKLVPQAALEALTPEAAMAVPQGMIIDGLISIHAFPYKIGRESRVQTVKGKIERVERPKLNDREPNNDLYLVDRGQLLNISREHMLIESGVDGYILKDRGSACGTKVNGQSLGGNDSGGATSLADGDEIVLGTADSPYRFRFINLNCFDFVEKK